MCIRDRPEGDIGTHLVGYLASHGVRAESVSTSRGGRGIGTVSYTHLRAHETVLDLVCRLLLEKKKA